MTRPVSKIKQAEAEIAELEANEYKLVLGAIAFEIKLAEMEQKCRTVQLEFATHKLNSAKVKFTTALLETKK